METGRPVAEKKATSDVVLQVSGNGDEAFITLRESPTNPFSSQLSEAGSSSKLAKDPSFELTVQTSNLSPSKAPKVPTETVSKRPSIPRSTFSKPKSRLVEPQYLDDPKGPKPISSSSSSSPARASSPSNKVASTPTREAEKSVPITPKTPLIGTPPGEEDDDEEVYKTANLKLSQQISKSSRVKFSVLIEWVSFVLIVGVLVASLTWDWLVNKLIWKLEVWKWCVLVLVMFCGRLFSEWFINILVFMIERNFLLRKKVLYFVYGLKRSVQVFIWIALILLAWALLFNRGVRRSRGTTKVLNYITRGLASGLIGAAIWLVKNLLVKLLASSFQSTRFFDRIQESIFHQYVLRTLSGPPLMEMAERVGRTPSTGQLSFKNLRKEKGEEKREGKEEVIDVEKLKKMKQEKVSAWTMKALINVIRATGLSTIANTLDDDEDEDFERPKDEEITSEWEAKAAAYRIFQNVARPGNK